MSWMKALVEHLGDAINDAVLEPVYRRVNGYLYDDEDKHEYDPEDDPEPPPPDPDPDYKGPDIPLHFNAWRDDEK